MSTTQDFSDPSAPHPATELSTASNNNKDLDAPSATSDTSSIMELFSDADSEEGSDSEEEIEEHEETPDLIKHCWEFVNEVAAPVRVMNNAKHVNQRMKREITLAVENAWNAFDLVVNRLEHTDYNETKLVHRVKDLLRQRKKLLAGDQAKAVFPSETKMGSLTAGDEHSDETIETLREHLKHLHENEVTALSPIAMTLKQTVQMPVSQQVGARTAARDVENSEKLQAVLIDKDQEIASIKEANARAMGDLQATHDRKVEKLKATVVEKDNAMKALADGNKRDIEQLQDTNDRAVQQLKALVTKKDEENAMSATRMRTSYVDCIKSLEARLVAKDNAVVNLRKELRESSRAANTTSMEEIEKFRAEVSGKEKDLNQIKQSRYEAVKGLRSSMQVRIGSLSGDLKLKEELIAELKEAAEDKDQELKFLWRKVAQHEAADKGDGSRKRSRVG